MVQYLHNEGEDDVMLVAKPAEILLQARTGHPNLVEWTTMSLLSYMPSLGPTIQKIYRDIYGIEFVSQPGRPQESRHWADLWTDRSEAEWNALSEEYGFRYVATAALAESGLAPSSRNEGKDPLQSCIVKAAGRV